MALTKAVVARNEAIAAKGFGPSRSTTIDSLSAQLIARNWPLVVR